MHEDERPVVRSTIFCRSVLDETITAAISHSKVNPKGRTASSGARNTPATGRPSSPALGQPIAASATFLGFLAMYSSEVLGRELIQTADTI